MLDDPLRLAALTRLQLLDGDEEVIFSRLARLAQRLVGSPMALITLVDHDRQFFMSAVGLPGPVAVARQTPLTHSFCRHVVTSGEALVIDDVLGHAIAGDNPAIREFGVMSYLGQPLHSPDGFVIGACCVMDSKPRTWSMTEIESMRELAELVSEQIAQRFASSQQHAKAALLNDSTEQVPGVCLQPDNALVATHASGNLGDLYGVSVGNLQSDAFNIFSLVHADDIAAVLDSIQKASKTMAPWRYESGVTEKDHSERWLSGQAASKRDADGALPVHDYKSDISQDKQAQFELAHLAAIVEYSDDAIISKNMLGVVTSWNKGAELMFGYSAQEMEGASISRIVPLSQQDEEAFILTKLVGGESVGHFDTVRKGKDGTLIAVTLSVSPIFDGNGLIIGISKVARDNRERKLAKSVHNHQTQKMLEMQKLESLGVLAGGIAHDFNNILTGILGNASLASFDLPASSPLQSNLSSITEASMRAADLCKQMLAYSGRGQFVVKNYSLNQLVEDTTNLLRVSINKKAVLRFNLSPDLPTIYADATQIRQVIMNLVINASEAIAAKSGVISLSTGLTRVDKEYLRGTLFAPELPDGMYVHLEVVDTGDGMTEEVQARVFDPFYSTKFAGRGLGLAAVVGIVRSHNGAIKLYSEPGRGTTFKLLFPSTNGALELFAEEISFSKAWRGRGCVLVADDEETVRSTVSLMLQKMGFTVALVADGREAIEEFRRSPDRYVAVLTDLTMPYCGGIEVFAEVRRIRPDLPFLLMSGFNQDEAGSGFTGKGLSGFVQKPFQFGDLRLVFEQALAGNNPAQ